MSKPVIGVVIAVLASIVIASAGSKPAATQVASSQPNAPARLELSGNETMDTLEKWVGREVTVCGYWGGPGSGKVFSYFIGGKEDGGEPVYLESKYTPDALAKRSWLHIPNGAYVEVRGELRVVRGERIASRPSNDRIAVSQPVQPHFYLDVEEASFRFPKK